MGVKADAKVYAASPTRLERISKQQKSDGTPISRDAYVAYKLNKDAFE